MNNHEAIEKILESNPEIKIMYASRGEMMLSEMSENIRTSEDIKNCEVEKIKCPGTIRFALIDTSKNKIVASIEVNTSDEYSMLYGIYASKNSRRYRALSFLATEFEQYQRRAK